jgi:hypothetical protein
MLVGVRQRPCGAAVVVFDIANDHGQPLILLVVVMEMTAMA